LIFLFSKDLTVSEGFSIMTTFLNFAEPHSLIPDIVGKFFQFTTSCERIKNFLKKEEIKKKIKILPKTTKYIFKYKNYLKKEKKENEKIKFILKKGEKLIICGEVGSGKSSFINTIIEEQKLIEGIFKLNSKKISYCIQNPYIRNCSFRDNILFYEEFDENIYKKVINLSCLNEDLKLLKFGDKTEIGDNGMNLR
jgi:ATP-binding cassette, subfamily C (CFTR/MRP), member 2